MEKQVLCNNIFQAINIENNGDEVPIFQIKRDGVFNPVMTFSNSNAITKVYISASGGSYYSAGNFGFGEDNPQYPLHLGSGAFCTEAGIWTNASDINYKKEIKNFDKSGLDIVNQLRSIT